MDKIAIIGAGPIGLYFASLCEKNNITYSLFEASDSIGGQIKLYPEKTFLDVEGFVNHKANDLIDYLKTQVNPKNIHLNVKVVDVLDKIDHVTIKTSKNEYKFEYAVIAIGLGAYLPRKMGIEHEEECSNILYSLTDKNMMKDKRVVVFGGGDSALDWAKEMDEIAKEVHLVHRRTEFRGNANTIKDCKNLKVHLPYVPHHLVKMDDKCVSITIKNVNEESYIDIPVDYVLVNYGSVPTATPFSLPHEGNFLKVNDQVIISKRILGIGDSVIYENKLRRIEPGKAEANKAFAYLSSLVK